MLDNNQIREIIPHRYPFLLVDRIISVEDGRKAVGLKTSAPMSHFSGAFSGLPGYARGSDH